MRKMGLAVYNGVEVCIDVDTDSLIANGVALPLDRAGTIATAFDGRYILVAVLVSVGATIFWFTDLLCCAFDTQANQWMTYTQNNWQSPDSGLKPNVLHVAHEARVNEADFAFPDVRWSLDFHAANRKRTIDPATGALGVIQ
jgi:hypothetical protein